MSRSADSAGGRTFELAERKGRVLDLDTVRRMLPLVERVVDDIVASRQVLDRLQPEQEQLDRCRRTLAWPDRLRRYNNRDELARAEDRLQDALAELDVLGIELVDAVKGRVGFPTVLNGRPAFYSWQPGEASIGYWHHPGEHLRRPIPDSLLNNAEPSLSSRA